MRADYVKSSRRHGKIFLASYAPGDGSIDFNWMSDSDRNGDTLNEPVTESDVSEWLELPENKENFKDWEVLELGTVRPQVRIAKIVSRPFHTSKKLQMDGQLYEYVYTGPEDPPAMHATGNTMFFLMVGKRRKEQVDTSKVMPLMFFLNHESDFERNGFDPRQRRVG